MTQALLQSLESTLETVEAVGHPDTQKLQAELIVAIVRLREEAKQTALGLEAGDPYPLAPKDPRPRKWLCWWDEDFNALVLQSQTGYFISFSISDGFWQAIQTEARAPGFIRELESKRTPESPDPKRLDDRTVLAAKAAWEQERGVKRYASSGKVHITLEDLDL